MNSLHNSSIRLMPGGFCVSNGELINITPGADYDKRLEDAILEQKLNIGEHDLHCYVETSRMSLSPAAECDKAMAEKMYGLTLRSTDQDETILHETSADGTVRISFGINSRLYHFLVRTFQYIVFHHPVISIIDHEAEKEHEGANWMAAEVTRGSLSIVAYKDNRLQLANCIETTVTQNRAYHILNTWTMLELDVITDRLYLTGDEQEVSRLKFTVNKFIKLCE